MVIFNSPSLLLPYLPNWVDALVDSLLKALFGTDGLLFI